MKRVLIYLCCFMAGCSQALTIGTGQSINPAVSYACPSGNNVMTVTVNGGLCSPNPNLQYINEPCASVTICTVGGTVGTSNCQTISNLLVDTGSYGLRVFSSVLSSTIISGLTYPLASSPAKPTGSTNNATSAAECVQFGSGRTWGPVAQADVYMAGEPYSRVQIQLINSSYSGGDSQSGVGCAGSDVSPNTTGYNGILGIGLFDEDCGSTCAGALPDKMYYACDGTVCSGVNSTHGAQMSLANQVLNPVAHFSGKSIVTASAADTNGLVFLTAAANGAGNAANNGCVVFGVNTQSNNVPATGTTLYQSTSTTSAQFTVKLGGTNYTSSFLDSGSNAIYMDSAITSIPECSGWYCPSSTLTENFVANSVTSTFYLANANTLFNTGNSIFNDLGGSASFSGTIDLGIPFFYGRPVWVGIEGQSTTAFSGASGAYWAY